MWGVELDDDTERKYSTYLRFCLVQGLDPIQEIEFVIGLLKKNAEAPKRVLKEALGQIQKELAGSTTEQKLNSITLMSGLAIPTMTQSVKDSILWPTFDINRALAKAVLVMLATDLAMDSNEVSGHSLTVWNDAESLKSIIESTLPRLRDSTHSAYQSQSPASSQIHPARLRVKYLADYADVEIVWTRHLPDHLELEGKKLRIFELASYLELSRNAMNDEAGIGLADCLKQGCFTSQFLTETLMTYPLLFPPKDRQWLKSQIKPHRNWTGWGWPTMTTALDPRLAAPFDNTLATDRYHRPLENSHELYERYPYWASRLHALYDEAQEPTPSTALGRYQKVGGDVNTHFCRQQL
ncbi:hypothetical protein J7T55_002450 [Diaporthe amygdali]|uniref:uncharacterized protein n=1 Tax=Phomopsis amygdali TaxID=1214568 RepID=UPI0022FDB9D2|nr:uncharacterized protein J7T55_002450 [Diaporthe amygdali]KAJ0121940.1 hypothetical protein J7T55_002450 [Diaporthe amygdali]